MGAVQSSLAVPGPRGASKQLTSKRSAPTLQVQKRLENTQPPVTDAPRSAPLSRRRSLTETTKSLTKRFSFKDREGRKSHERKSSTHLKPIDESKSTAASPTRSETTLLQNTPTPSLRLSLFPSTVDPRLRKSSPDISDVRNPTPQPATSPVTQIFKPPLSPLRPSEVLEAEHEAKMVEKGQQANISPSIIQRSSPRFMDEDEWRHKSTQLSIHVVSENDNYSVTVSSSQKANSTDEERESIMNSALQASRSIDAPDIDKNRVQPAPRVQEVPSEPRFSELDDIIFEDLPIAIDIPLPNSASTSSTPSIELPTRMRPALYLSTLSPEPLRLPNRTSSGSSIANSYKTQRSTGTTSGRTSPLRRSDNRIEEILTPIASPRTPTPSGLGLSMPEGDGERPRTDRSHSDTTPLQPPWSAVSPVEGLATDGTDQNELPMLSPLTFTPSPIMSIRNSTVKDSISEAELVPLPRSSSSSREVSAAGDVPVPLVPPRSISRPEPQTSLSQDSSSYQKVPTPSLAPPETIPLPVSSGRNTPYEEEEYEHLEDLVSPLSDDSTGDRLPLGFPSVGTSKTKASEPPRTPLIDRAAMRASDDTFIDFRVSGTYPGHGRSTSNESHRRRVASSIYPAHGREPSIQSGHRASSIYPNNAYTSMHESHLRRAASSIYPADGRVSLAGTAPRASSIYPSGVPTPADSHSSSRFTSGQLHQTVGSRDFAVPPNTPPEQNYSPLTMSPFNRPDSEGSFDNTRSLSLDTMTMQNSPPGSPDLDLPLQRLSVTREQSTRASTPRPESETVPRFLPPDRMSEYEGEPSPALVRSEKTEASQTTEGEPDTAPETTAKPILEINTQSANKLNSNSNHKPGSALLHAPPSPTTPPLLSATLTAPFPSFPRFSYIPTSPTPPRTESPHTTLAAQPVQQPSELPPQVAPRSAPRPASPVVRQPSPQPAPQRIFRTSPRPATSAPIIAPPSRSNTKAPSPIPLAEYLPDSAANTSYTVTPTSNYSSTEPETALPQFPPSEPSKAQRMPAWRKNDTSGGARISGKSLKKMFRSTSDKKGGLSREQQQQQQQQKHEQEQQPPMPRMPGRKVIFQSGKWVVVDKA